MFVLNETLLMSVPLSVLLNVGYIHVSNIQTKKVKRGEKRGKEEKRGEKRGRKRNIQSEERKKKVLQT